MQISYDHVIVTNYNTNNFCNLKNYFGHFLIDRLMFSSTSSAYELGIFSLLAFLSLLGRFCVSVITDCGCGGYTRTF